ncbi:phosphoribosylanthranilate isomerase [Kordiimonas lipolytica]|uniref:N-(5'-phosphoribosyl)anthranilate isomerase n=1 Tax=Kordiimonas lipolytica TaxID=1662421 RepID=A0ABV8UC58_9PROT|nr:phosphoribosylanthranilate isomerase [Kordiimonas lipolytica]
MSVSVKICGITKPEHANLAAFYGARWLGFVFFDKSPRNLTLKDAAAMRRQLPSSTERVGLFVNADHDFIEDACDALDLDWVQLHGDEYPNEALILKNRLGVSIIKAIGVSTAEDIDQADMFAPHVDAILFDAKPPKGSDRPGGNAHSFPWNLLSGRDLPYPWLLAGGLTPENVRQAVQESGAHAVDVSSGVEDAPGKKSGEKIEAFLSAAKAVR